MLYDARKYVYCSKQTAVSTKPKSIFPNNNKDPYRAINKDNTQVKENTNQYVGQLL